MLFAVTVLLLPSRLQSPSCCPVETIAAPATFTGNWCRQGVPIGRQPVGEMELSGIEPLSETVVWIT